MQVGVTGSTGLIGASVLAAVAGPHRAVTIGRRPGAALQADLSRPETVAALDLGGLDALVHCAGVVDEDFRADAAAAWRHATLGSAALVARARACGVRRFIYVSTAHVYGPLVGTIDDDAALNPLSDYALAHHASEQILRRSCGPELTGFVLRPCAVFGVPLALDSFDRWSLIPYAFPLSAAYRHQIVLKSAGAQRRNFVSAAHVARTALGLLEAPAAAPFTALNPVGGADLSVLDFAQACAAAHEKVTGRPCAVERAPAAREAGDDFRYTSHRSVAEPEGAIRAYLEEIIDRLVREERGGRRYGS